MGFCVCCVLCQINRHGLGEWVCGVTHHLSYSRLHLCLGQEKILAFNLGANMVLHKTECEEFLVVDRVCFGFFLFWFVVVVLGF